MFEAAELGRKVSKQEFEEVAPALRLELVELQQHLRHSDFPVVIVFEGVDGAGKHELVNVLNEWMDPRWIVTSAYGGTTREEGERPEYWRFWRDLPARDQIGIFLSAWYSRPLLDRVYGHIDQERYDEHLDRILAFENTLADDGALILKFWMHLGRKAQKKRLKKLEKDPLTDWQVDKRHWENWERYDDFITAGERAIMRTSTGKAPWKIVEGSDHRYRSLTVLTAIRDGIRQHMVTREAQGQITAAMESSPRSKPAKKTGESSVVTLSGQPTILNHLDMDLTVPDKRYGAARRELRARLNGLYRRIKGNGISTILVFEGWDASGKGGTIRRLVGSLDARDYRVLPIAKPTDEEAAHHYLWRFWRHLPRAGRITVFDRSWYGRVLVERAEGFATEAEWRRAYAEINDFEEQLVDHGMVIAKFWMHITKEEQLRRFKVRESTPYKRWKLTDEDWRNRDKWDLYEEAVNEMIERTSTFGAPWTLVEGNDKRYARLKVIRTLCEHYEERLARINGRNHKHGQNNKNAKNGKSPKAG